VLRFFRSKYRIDMPLEEALTAVREAERI